MAHIEATTTDPSRKTGNKMEDYPAKAQYTNIEAESKYRRGRWTTQEHQMFLAGLKIHGRNWKNISLFVKTRSSVQTRTHAQKYFLKQAQGASKDTKASKKIQISEIKKRRKRTTNQTRHQISNKINRTVDKVAKTETYADQHNSDNAFKVFDKLEHTPQIYPPAPQQPNYFHEMAKDDAKYARSLDLVFPIFPTKSKPHQTDFQIPTPIELDFQDEESVLYPVDITTHDIFNELLV
mmetsp:Transcript_12171/g.15131  ORF Transcript_12171/g.15131 Transcript_12171/m.15131 type:complete len:237 (-) Transcript_12171:308-1018(-)|eukprot:CAMPEP_0204823810 /NCGR_PEP_ID=MMETSP1346-20131115/1881_1 /ASSEMBLY_ACC=CAM_ASM_000771 /TAXON_ID=215587 /ORGANISM="Aplanochytrium stocchinoi, Strain GSBS06" /LENGTH=236 /DNA_ID=CAMNT_0051950609 /DNA_START=72 /DNA_END=782 /DNA_ORIENTATION=-